MFKFYKSSSKFTVKVTCLKSMHFLIGKVRTQRTHIRKTRMPMSYSEKFMANVKK